MAKQSLLWTALPNGYTDDHRSLRVSLFLSPRLDAQLDAKRLTTFPDFVDWPATLADARFGIRLGAKVVNIDAGDTISDNRIDDRLGTPDTGIWKAIFPDPDKTFVQGYKFRDLSDNVVLSFPAVSIDMLIRNLYSRLAANATDQLPTATTMLDDRFWGEVVTFVERHDGDRRFTDFRNGARDPSRQFKLFEETGFKHLSGLARDLALFQLFHTPSSRSKIDKYDVAPEDPKARAKWLGYEQSTLPKPTDFQSEIDFHKIVAAMSSYPTLLRLLGLVVDVLIRRDSFDHVPSALLQASVRLPDGSSNVKREPDVSPRTRTLFDSQRFQPVTRTHPDTGDYRTVNGLLDLKDVFDVLQADVDGGGHKVMNFARTLVKLKNESDHRFDPTTRHEREIGAPSLRNAGLMLVHTNRGAMLKNSFDRQKTYNEAAEKIQKEQPQLPPILFAEDLVRGWRIDIWEDRTKQWHSLCRRVADYDLNSGEILINVPEEEGAVKLAATKSIDPSNNGKIIWLHEALISWTGWSLCAPPPGRTIHHDDSDHTDPVGEPEAELPPGLHLRSKFKALPGSLPRLRYGRSYWLRARAVDLAGNSLPFSDQDLGSEKPNQNARAYLRFEPILAPSLALYKPSVDPLEEPAEGESMDHMAVRTFNPTPADNTIPSPYKTRRFAVPSRTTHKEAEHHGMLDRDGIVDPSYFAMLAAKDNSLVEEKVPTEPPLPGEPPQVKTSYAVMQEADELPYLPEPLAVVIAARIFDHPGISPDKIIRIPLYSPEAEWPDALPFKIELYENPGDKPRFSSSARTLFIPLPKAIRASLRLSVMPTREALELLGVWNWLTPAQRNKLLEMALKGLHWMLTPWRNIDLVHAVQKPLITPEIIDHRIDREFAATFALPQFITPCSIKSTDHLDLLATWNEPTENVNEAAAGENRERSDHAFAVKITEPKNYAGVPEYLLEEPDVIRAGGSFHNRVKTKLHEFHDTRYRRIEYQLEATTAFREYMPFDLLNVKIGDEFVPTDEHIKVTGPVLRTWIPNSAPPPAPEVLYVVPTFGWVRSTHNGRKSSWRRGGGLRVYLNRPWNVTGYGEMLAVVLPPASFSEDPNTNPGVQPYKNFVTQWGNDPIWLSPFVSGSSPKRSDFPLARTAPDPTGKWLPDFAKAEEADQPPGPFRVTGLPHPELRPDAVPQGRVEIAPHDVFYDEVRRLWYCDIEVNWGRSYYPFIRLALARYQPVSVPDANPPIWPPSAYLSNIVIADFMALVPDRWLNVTRTRDPKTRRVSVFGSSYSDSSGHTEAQGAPDVARSSVIEIWLERFHSVLGEDFGWIRESGASVQRDRPALKNRTAAMTQARIARDRVRAKDLLRARQFDVLIRDNLIDKVFVTPSLWEGTVTLPVSRAEGDNRRYRIAVAEYEEYLVDGPEPYNPNPTDKDRRLVFIEYVELD